MKIAHFYKAIAVFLVFLTGAQLVQAEPVIQPKQAFEPGVDYRKVKAKQLQNISDISQLQQLPDIEIFYWYGSAASLLVEQALDEYLTAHPQLIVRRTPLVAHLSWRPQAYLQPMLEQLVESSPAVKLMSIRDDIYAACIDDCSLFASYELAKAWLQGKVPAMPQLLEASIWQAENDYRKRAELFSINQVPTVLIREKYTVDANSAKSPERMISILDYLLFSQAN